MCRQCDVQKAVGGWVQFRTPWGYHRGMVEQVNTRGVLVKVPSEYAPISLASCSVSGKTEDERLNLALAYGGYGGNGGYGPGYGAGPGYGGRWGYPGYGAWGGGWWWWWLAFAWIFAFAFLWW